MRWARQSGGAEDAALLAISGLISLTRSGNVQKFMLREGGEWVG